jgi:hypothetical protein
MALLSMRTTRRIWQAGCWSLACAGAVLLPGPAGHAAEAGATADIPAEYQIKAVYLFNFAQFVEWPAKAFADAKAPLVIGVLGEDPFGAALDETVKDEKVGARRITVRRFAKVEDVQDCHILFVSRSEAGRFDAIMAALKGRPVFTIGDTKGFTKAGGMVRLVTDGTKIRLAINLAEAKASGVIVSSKIVRPATIVTRDSEN